MSENVDNNHVECSYPGCSLEGIYAPAKSIKWFRLCEEHYKLFKFIRESIFILMVDRTF